MQSVIFTCRHCGKEMAVAAELLGVEVRCPHCQQVVPAPAAVTWAAPAGAPETGPPQGQSIFDDVPPVHDSESAAWDPPSTTTLFLPSEAEPTATAPTNVFDPTTEILIPGSGIPAPGRVGEAAGQHARREKLLSMYLLIFLIPYSILMTAAALWFYFQMRNTPHPLENLPDWPRDNDQPTRQGAMFQRLDDTGPFPRQLRVRLGEALRVGDLEVMPTGVRREPIIFRYENAARREERSRHEALTLTLQVRNLSEQVTFAPNDLFFNRKWRDGMAKAQRPYTCLEVGSTRFYGGPCEWKPRKSRPDELREFVHGSCYNDFVKPGGNLTYGICTDPENTDILSAVERATGPLLWRVQVRRGLERVKDRTMTATAVVGVEFDPRDIRRN